MINRYANVSQLINSSPTIANILMNYGIPCYGNTENQLSTLDDVAVRYGIDITEMLELINGKTTTSLF